ncbi:extracellular solute-binding protein [Pseudooceanicola nanhaiensis]|uniref:extracellular solute-binding protein n=1 Tax=Pseudooceanicola nanhaiensis TaxID=375761 RepID=UPI001CD4EFAA|nr:extracellular solute-binding protein [Pseudooceanicola nanhaiensis]MCA0921287.1 extracellular solute-binding protein [Pseudooceanicola nanhaiensis]
MKFKGMSRRELLAGLAATGAGSLVGTGLRAQDVAEILKGDGHVVVCTWGGHYTDVMDQIWFSKFTDATGITTSATAIPDMSKLEVMDKVNNVEWDLIDTEGTQMLVAIEKDLLEPIDYDLIFSVVPKEQIDPKVMKEYGIGSVAFSTCIGWNPKTIGEEGPQSWQELFDESKFKGRLGLYAQPRPTFEIALMAAGVPKDEIYPISIDEAFEACDAIKDKVDLWVERTSQWGVLMESGEVDLCGASLSRLVTGRKEGYFDFNFNQAIVEQSYWTVPKNAPGKEDAMKLIAWMMQAEGMREYASQMPYTMANTSIYDAIPEEHAKTLPGYPANAEKNMNIDETWWGANAEEVRTRWLDWMSS